MMPTPLLALFGLVLGSLIVFGPNSTTAFTVKLLGDDYTFGEVYVESLDKKNRTSIPNWDEVFPDHNGNESSRGNVDSPTSDELSLDLLSLRAPMTNNEIDDYLIKYGYLRPAEEGIVTEEERKEAIKKFQRFFHLKETGIMDKSTMKRMQTSRCGVSDPIINAKLANFDASDGSKWSKKKLTYRIINYTPDLPNTVVRETVAKAFKFWSDASQLTFTEVLKGPSDLKLRFSPKTHGDGADFDGPGNVLAHAFFPQSGEIHMDEAETWTVKSILGVNLLSVLVHEIGHALGLGHSDVNDAAMAPLYNGYQANLALHKDDIEGIQYLYGKPISVTPKPTTKAPTTKAPTTKAPTTKAPTTQAPTTKAPTTQAPTTKAPTTQAPTTKAPTTQAPTTKAPTTQAPTTKTPTTKAPTTQAPTTRAPTTVPTTTKYLPTTTHPILPKPTLPKRKFSCPFPFWAIMTAGKRTYGFYRRTVYQILPYGRIVNRGYISYFFPRGPDFVTAAAYNKVTRRTFLFYGLLVYRYTDHSLDSGFPKRLKYYVRAAAVVDNQLIAFSFTHIHYLDEDTLGDIVDGQLSIKDEYPNLPTPVRSAVSYDEGHAYILYTYKVVKLNIHTGEMTQASCYQKV